MFGEWERSFQLETSGQRAGICIYKYTYIYSYIGLTLNPPRVFGEWECGSQRATRGQRAEICYWHAWSSSIHSHDTS